jgi:hypothetical protein
VSELHEAGFPETLRFLIYFRKTILFLLPESRMDSGRPYRPANQVT